MWYSKKVCELWTMQAAVTARKLKLLSFAVVVATISFIFPGTLGEAACAKTD